MVAILGVLVVGASPDLAYLLPVLGLALLTLEVLHPGLTIGGILGTLALAGAGILLASLPVTGQGLAFVVFGLALMAAEAFLPGGIAGTVGLAGIVAGGLYLFDGGVQVSRGVVAGTGLAGAVFAYFVVNALVRARRLPPAQDLRDLVGTVGVVEQALGPVGVVRACNESWTARTEHGVLREGAQVRVKSVHGLALHVEPINAEPPNTGE